MTHDLVKIETFPFDREAHQKDFSDSDDTADSNDNERCSKKKNVVVIGKRRIYSKQQRRFCQTHRMNKLLELARGETMLPKSLETKLDLWLQKTIANKKIDVQLWVNDFFTASPIRFLKHLQPDVEDNASVDHPLLHSEDRERLFARLNSKSVSYFKLEHLDVDFDVFHILGLDICHEHCHVAYGYMFKHTHLRRLLTIKELKVFFTDFLFRDEVSRNSEFFFRKGIGFVLHGLDNEMHARYIHEILYRILYYRRLFLANHFYPNDAQEVFDMYNEFCRFIIDH